MNKRHGTKTIGGVHNQNSHYLIDKNKKKSKLPDDNEWR